MKIIFSLFCLTHVLVSSYTNRLIHAKDHASVQINIGHVDEAGLYTQSYTTYALAGFLRGKAESDMALNVLATKDGFLKTVQTSVNTVF
jgi:small subunit ribosomal protein S21e